MPFVLLLIACAGDPKGGGGQADLDGDGVSAEEGDCRDTDPSAFPGAEEVCNGLDDDCDGKADEDLSTRWYADADGDAYGHDSYPRDACAKPDGYAAEGGDCDDADDDVHPNADEHCDGVDEDCDGIVDEEGAVDGDRWYLDQDGDGYGIDEDVILSCTEIEGRAREGGDCDDTDPTVYPDAPEIAVGVDNDCDGEDGNTLPEAVPVCTDEQPVTTCMEVTLDGTGSVDADGDAILSWSWKLVAAPTGSTITTGDIDDRTEPVAYFTPDAEGTFSFTLETHDGTEWGLASTLDVEVIERPGNRTPVADAGPDVATSATTTCTETSYGYRCTDCSSIVSIDGSASYDLDGDPITWAWSETSAYAAFLSDDQSAAALQITGVEGDMGVVVTETIAVTLVVEDCMHATSTDTVEVVMTCAE